SQSYPSHNGKREIEYRKPRVCPEHHPNLVEKQVHGNRSIEVENRYCSAEDSRAQFVVSEIEPGLEAASKIDRDGQTRIGTTLNGRSLAGRQFHEFAGNKLLHLTLLLLMNCRSYGDARPCEHQYRARLR